VSGARSDENAVIAKKWCDYDSYETEEELHEALERDPTCGVSLEAQLFHLLQMEYLPE
jgi:hypothetical protein